MIAKLDQIVACAFGDRLRARAAAGDLEALRALAATAPRHIPPRARLAYRDPQIRIIAAGLFASLPGASRHAIAVILDRAGRDLTRKRALTGRPPFDRLLPEERDRLEAGVRALLEIARWPALRQIEQILSLQFLAVETANNSGVGLAEFGDQDAIEPQQSRSRRSTAAAGNSRSGRSRAR